MIRQPEQNFCPLKSRLPDALSQAVLARIRQRVDYEPVIGIMGKTGAGKSSLCNTFFSPPPARVDAVSGCTRQVQRYTVSRGQHHLHIVDFPGIAETPERDLSYRRLYQAWSEKLDLIVWVLKADDRAWSDDIRSYRELIRAGADPQRFLFVLSQADKTEPCREWDLLNHRPSSRQHKNLQAKAALADSLFSSPHPIIAVSASENYNLHRWAEALILALPAHSSSAVSRHLAPDLRTEKVKNAAREGFVRLSGEIFDDAVGTLCLSGLLMSRLSQLRRKFLSVIRATWHLLF